MTIDEALSLIAQRSKPGDWIKYGPIIRHRETQECPMCFLGSQLGCNPHGMKATFDRISFELKLPYQSANDIAAAADSEYAEKREDVMKACHLLAANGQD